MRDANTLVDVSSYVLTTLSGANFPVHVLPGFLLPTALALPPTYGYDALRVALLDSRTILPVSVEVVISCAFMVVMTVAGAAVFRQVERHCRRLGPLGLH